jgi:hypothetical protein
MDERTIRISSSCMLELVRIRKRSSRKSAPLTMPRNLGLSQPMKGQSIKS